MTDEPSFSQRGFARFDEIPGHYGGKVQTYESSGVTPCAWLNIVELDDLCGPKDGPTHEATILLLAADARRLAAQLVALADRVDPEEADG